MSIDPDQTCIGVDSHGTRDSSKSDRVITTQGQGEGALLEVGGDRGGDRLGHGRDVAGVQELANWGVALRAHQRVVAVAVKLDLPVELLQLVKKTKLDDLERAQIDTISGLEKKVVIGIHKKGWDENPVHGAMRGNLISFVIKLGFIAGIFSSCFLPGHLRMGHRQRRQTFA